MAVWLSLTTLLELSDSKHANNSFALLKHVVTHRYSVTSVALCNVKSHFKFMTLTLGFVVLVCFSKPLITCSYRISGKVNFNYFQMRQSVLSSALMLYNSEGWSYRTYTNIYTNAHMWLIVYLTPTIKVCMLFFTMSLLIFFISSPIVSLFFFCTEMETKIL